MRHLLLLSLLCLSACSSAPTLDFDALHGTLTEAQARALQPKLDWQCSDDTANGGMLGQRVCDGLLTELNGLPATRIDYLFRDGTLSFALIEYTPDGFAALAQQMDAKHQKRAADGNLGGAARMFSSPPTAWTVADGIAMSSATDKKPNGNVFVLWISAKEALRAAAGHG